MGPDHFHQTRLYKSIMPKPHIGLRITSRLKPHKANAKYLLKHKWHVLRAGLKLNVPLWRLVVHDWSKLTPIEWFAYTCYFFGKKASDHNMYVPGKKPEPPPIEVRTEGDVSVNVTEDSDNYHEPHIRQDDVVMESVLTTADAPNLNDDVFPKELLDKVVDDHIATAAAADRVAQQFDKAWLHHIHYNPHHWQHWVLSQDDGDVKCLEMPANFAREMVADWVGAGIAQGKTDKTSVLVWYEKNKESIKLHNQTRELVESLIKVYVYS